MEVSKEFYKWFYNRIHSRYYDLMIKCLMIPFGGESKWRDKMLEFITFSKKEKILDMCCGTGGATLAISKKVAKGSTIIGIDLSSGQLRHAKKRNYLCDVQFMEGDVTNTGYPDSFFDKVFITHAIHEMKREIRLETLRESYRVLKANGQLSVLELDNPNNVFLRLFIFIWFLYWLPFNFETPTRRDMLRNGVINEVKEVGFLNVRKYSIYSGVCQTVTGDKQPMTKKINFIKTSVY